MASSAAIIMRAGGGNALGRWSNDLDDFGAGIALALFHRAGFNNLSGQHAGDKDGLAAALIARSRHTGQPVTAVNQLFYG